MISKPLASISKIVAGQSPESSTYNSIGDGLPFFQGKADFQDMYPTARMWCTSEKRKEAEPGDILISVRAPVGAVNICNQKSIIGRGLTAIRPSTELDGKFLYYWLKANERQIDALGTGSTFKAITQETLKKIEVPVPPLGDQIRIAHLLGKVEALITQRKQHLQQLDDLLKSVFLEMFGDPVRNEKGWDKPELKAFGKISTGNTPPRNEPANYDGDFIEWIKTDNITGDAVFVTSSTEHLSELGTKKARTVTSGALLVACIAGSVESIGRAALTDRTVSFNQQINAIQPANDVNPMYLYGLFKLSRTYIQSHATKGMKKILTKGDFEKITMIKPPFELQKQFALIVEKIEGIKARLRLSLAELESLYGSLSQQAFNGDLNV
jgi:type I restriction enzyme S subunit